MGTIDCRSPSVAKMTCVSSAVKCFSVLLVALAVIFLINFAIISIYDGVEPRCYGYDYWGNSYRYTINLWEGLWIPIPSCVTGILGMTTACGPNQCKKWALLVFAILTTLFNLSAFSPLVVSFLDTYCDDGENEARSSYFLIQIGLIFLFSVTSLTLSVLTCLYKPTEKTIQGAVLPTVHMVAGTGQYQQPLVYMVQQQPHLQQQYQQHQQYQQQQQPQPPSQLQAQGEAQPQFQRAQP